MLQCNGERKQPTCCYQFYLDHSASKGGHVENLGAHSRDNRHLAPQAGSRARLSTRSKNQQMGAAPVLPDGPPLHVQSECPLTSQQHSGSQLSPRDPPPISRSGKGPTAHDRHWPDLVCDHIHILATSAVGVQHKIAVLRHSESIDVICPRSKYLARRCL